MTSGSLLSWAQQSTCVLCGEGAQQTETLNCFLCKKPAHKLCVGLKEATKGNILWSCDSCNSSSLADIAFELSELKLKIAKFEKIPEKMDIMYDQVNQFKPKYSSFFQKQKDMPV